MQLYIPCNFSRVIATLPPDRRPTDPDRAKILRNQLEALLDVYFFKLPPTLAASRFGVFSEKKNLGRSKGGRPRHISMDTLIFALADLYARETSSSIEALPVSESSRFVNFMDSCLSPLYRDADLASALARRWRDMRKAIRALPSASPARCGHERRTEKHSPAAERMHYPIAKGDASLADGRTSGAWPNGPLVKPRCLAS